MPKIKGTKWEYSTMKGTKIRGTKLAGTKMRGTKLPKKGWIQETT